MEVLLSFLLAFFFSFIGSIPPGTLNLSMVQLGLEQRMEAAWRFAFAAALIEYPYAWLAVEFESIITSSPLITENIQLITASVMILLGTFNLLSSRQQGNVSQKFNNSGFRRGLILSILNPLALPFWIGITAYLRGLRWIDLGSNLELHAYLAGVSLGAFTLLILLAYLAKRIVSSFQESKIIKKIPGVTMLALGIYALMEYIL